MLLPPFYFLKGNVWKQGWKRDNLYRENSKKGAIMKRSTRICIIGAGPGGLMAALTLRRLGYNNITVLNQDTRHIGGQCHTVMQDELACDTGAVFVLGNYPTVERLARQAGVRLRKAPSSCHSMWKWKHQAIWAPGTSHKFLEKTGRVYSYIHSNNKILSIVSTPHRGSEPVDCKEIGVTLCGLGKEISLEFFPWRSVPNHALLRFWVWRTKNSRGLYL